MSDSQPTKGCPPDKNEYDAWSGGSYAQKMLWRGFIPIAGPFMQQTVDKPPTCEDLNSDLQAQMSQNIATFEMQASQKLEDTWDVMRLMLGKLTYMSAIVSALRTTPLEFKLLYLFAGATSLGLLSLAIMLSI
uniref:Uncharacterized protein n=1 Tax=viral metagenome TaxID=1070528 RepID=A0A6C0C0K1_9ZZZZ